MFIRQCFRSLSLSTHEIWRLKAGKKIDFSYSEWSITSRMSNFWKSDSSPLSHLVLLESDEPFVKYRKNKNGIFKVKNFEGLRKSSIRNQPFNLFRNSFRNVMKSIEAYIKKLIHTYQWLKFREGKKEKTLIVEKAMDNNKMIPVEKQTMISYYHNTTSRNRFF